MSNSFVVSKLAKKNSAPRPVPKAGTVPARILQFIDLGIQNQPPYQGEPKPPKRQVMFTFEIAEKMEYNGEMVPMRMSTKPFSLSNDPKSGLFKFMQSVDPTGALGGDLSKYVNLPVFVTIVHAERVVDGQKRVYANIAGCMPAPEGMPIAPLHDEPCVFTFDNPTAEEYAKLPEWLHNKIGEALNFEGSKVEPIAKAYVPPVREAPVAKEEAAPVAAAPVKGKRPF